jgi:hypothetical protein
MECRAPDRKLTISSVRKTQARSAPWWGTRSYVVRLAGNGRRSVNEKVDPSLGVLCTCTELP